MFVERTRDHRTFLIHCHGTDSAGIEFIDDVNPPEIGWVIMNGYHERRKDEFKPEYKAWNYAIRGKTLEERNLRIAISFEGETELLIITVIDLDQKDE